MNNQTLPLGLFEHYHFLWIGLFIAPIIALSLTILPASAQNNQTEKQTTTETGPLMETRAVVSADLIRGADGTVNVVLTMDKNWHVNANAITMDFLIPTTVEPETLNPDYPAGKMLDTLFGDIAVYSGEVKIPVSFDNVDQSDTIEVTAQACDGATCYPPSTWDFTINDIKSKSLQPETIQSETTEPQQDKIDQ